MYLVDTLTFKKFIDKNGFGQKIIPKPVNLPCIIEFPEKSVLKAKVEVKSYSELRNVIKFNKQIISPVNKYWIRGEEWKLNLKGKPIQELSI